jgi:hypothetical protein
MYRLKTNLFIDMHWSRRLMLQIMIVVGNFHRLVLGSANPPINYKT